MESLGWRDNIYVAVIAREDGLVVIVEQLVVRHAVRSRAVIAEQL